MARRFVSLLLFAIVSSIAYSANVIQYPHLNPFAHQQRAVNPIGSYQQQQQQARIVTFDLNDYSSLMQRTTTTLTSTTITFLITATCTRSTSQTCAGNAAADSNKAPFLSGFARKRRAELLEMAFFKPSQVDTVEPTPVPEEKSFLRENRSVGSSSVLLGPYEMHQLESSLARELSPLSSTNQAGRLFSFTFTTNTVTLTSFFTTTSVTTRTLTPSCSTSGYFTQCP